MKFNLVFLGKTKPPSFITICGAFQRQEPKLVHIQTQEKVLLNSKLPYTSKQVLLRRKTDSSAGASSAMVSSTRSSSVLARALKQPTPMTTKPKNDKNTWCCYLGKAVKSSKRNGQPADHQWKRNGMYENLQWSSQHRMDLNEKVI